MNNQELSILEAQGWRFCDIPPANGMPTKGPRVRDWQRILLTQDKIADGHNIGVILGEASNGILAIDFDGEWAWQYWAENIKIPFEDIDTVAWSSGKVGRAQMAFQVPQELWHIMPTKFAISGPLGDDGKPQQLEIRWGNLNAGFQSVLPPSLHPEGVKNPNIYYQWLRAPSQCNVLPVPDKLLEFILTYQPPHKEPQVYDVQPKDIEELHEHDVDRIDALMKLLKKKHSSLEYETWLKVTWAVFKELGPQAGCVIMQQYYPEQSSGEYARLTRGYNPGKSPGFRTLRHLVKDLLVDPLQGKRTITKAEIAVRLRKEYE